MPDLPVEDAPYGEKKQMADATAAVPLPEASVDAPAPEPPVQAPPDVQDAVAAQGGTLNQPAQPPEHYSPGSLMIFPPQFHARLAGQEPFVTDTEKNYNVGLLFQTLAQNPHADPLTQFIARRTLLEG